MKSIIRTSLALILALLFCIANASALNGDYRTHQSGNWNDVNTWERHDGTNWIYPALTTPTRANALTISIQNGHTATVTADVTVDQVIVSAGGKIIINNGITLTVGNNTGTDVTVNGAIQVDGIVLQGDFSSITINGVLEIGSSGSLTGGGGNGAARPSVTVASGGGLTVASGGSIAVSGSAPTSITINTGGIAILNGAVTGADVITIDGTVIATANITMSSISALNIGGTLTMSAGTLTTQRGNGGTVGSISGTLELGGTSTWSITGISTATASVVSGGTLRIGPTAYVTGSGGLIINSGANLSIGSADGINNTTTSGNVRTNASDTFNPSANYTYNGCSSQVTGTELPTTVNNFTIANSSGAVTPTNDLTVNGTLSVLSGATFQKIGAYTLTVGAGGVSNSGSIVLNGTTIACGEVDNLLVRSTSIGVQRSWSGTGIYDIEDIDAQDQGGSFAVFSCTNTGNTSWNFNPDCCTVNAGPDQNFCADNATLTGNDPSPGTGLWTLESGSGTISSPTSYNSGVTGLGNGANTFRWTVTRGGGCSVMYDEVIFTRGNPTPTFITAPGSTVCVNSDVTYTTESGKSNYTWTVPGILNIDYSITSGGIGPTSNSVTLRWLTSGSKTVTVNYTAYCCTGANAATNTTQAIAAGLWLGTTNTDWFTGTNWCGAVPTSTTDVVIPSSAPNMPIVGQNLGVCRNMTINSGGTLTISPTYTLSVYGNWSNSGTFTSTGSTVDFTGSNAATIGTSTFNNLTISGSGTKTAAGALTITGDVNITGAFSADAFEHTVGGNWTKSGTFTATGSTIDFNSSDAATIGSSNFHNITFSGSGTKTAEGTLTVAGNWTNNGTYSPGSCGGSPYGLVEFNGSSLQTISGTATTFCDLTINSSGGVQLDQNAQMNHTLTLSSGRILTNDKTFTFGPTATNTGGSSTSFISMSNFGKVRKLYPDGSSVPPTFTFPIGTETNKYSPMSLTYSAGTFSSAYLEVMLRDIKHPSLVATDYINRYWSLSASGISSLNYDAIFTYLDGDVTGTEANMLVAKSTNSGSTWSKFGSVTIGTNELSTGGGQTGFSDFTGADVGASPVELTSFNARTSGSDVVLNWRTATEANNTGFAVERSPDAQSWSQIGFVKGHGTSNTPNDYSFMDAGIVLKAVGDKLQYRLIQIDRDGTQHRSPVVEIALKRTSKNIELLQNYPNPFKPETNIAFILPSPERVTLTVFDTYGREVSRLYEGVLLGAGSYSNTFSGTGLPSGTYRYQLQTRSMVLTRTMVLSK